MIWFLVACCVAILGLTAFVASGRWGGIAKADDDTPAPELPEGDLSREDILGAKFAVVMRGYSMTQVDLMLARLADQIEQSDSSSGELPPAEYDI